MLTNNWQLPGSPYSDLFWRVKLWRNFSKAEGPHLAGLSCCSIHHHQLDFHSKPIAKLLPFLSQIQFFLPFTFHECLSPWILESFAAPPIAEMIICGGLALNHHQHLGSWVHSSIVLGYPTHTRRHLTRVWPPMISGPLSYTSSCITNKYLLLLKGCAHITA